MATPCQSVEVAIAQVREEAAEADRPGHDEEPPGPGLPLPKRERRQPQVQQADGYQRAAEGNPVVDHEVDDAAAIQGTQLASGDAQEQLVVRQELARCCQEQGKQP